MSRAIPPNTIEFPLTLAASNQFGRDPKISAERAYNMFISDGWSVPTPGHLKVDNIDPKAEGREIFKSNRGNFMLMVIGNGVYLAGPEIAKYGREIEVGDVSEVLSIRVGTLETYTGDVFIDENRGEQIAICDKKDIYIYNYSNNTFQKATLDFIPGYVVYQDGYFIASDLEKPEWRLSALNNGLSWPYDAQHVGELETKADNTKACVRMPGKGNQLFVMGGNVVESWNDVGATLFPYRKTTTFNIDYGCVNQSTIADADKFIVWLGTNEKSSPVILVSDGGPAQQISSDGINLELANATDIEDSYGFLWKSDGHLFYQLTLRSDKVTYLYDFNTQKNYFLTDEKFQNHIAKRITFFAGDYYFISFIDGNLYRLDSNLSTYDGKVIPKMIITNTVRLPSNRPFIADSVNFRVMQGDDTTIDRIDIALSYDGGRTFSNNVGKELNSIGYRQNIFTEYHLGLANEMTFRFMFWGKGRFICTDGKVEARV